MRGSTDLSLAPLERRSNAGKHNQGASRGADASPTRTASHGSPGGHRGGPFPPVPRPGTTSAPYLLSGSRRQLPGSGALQPEHSRAGEGGGSALPRLDSIGPGGGGGGGHRQSPQHTRSGNGACSSSAAARNGRSSVSPRDGQAPAPPITWAQVRDAQQHAWAELSGLYRSHHYALAAAAAAQQQHPLPYAPLNVQSSWGELSWGGDPAMLAGGSSSFSLTSPNGASGGPAVVATSPSGVVVMSPSGLAAATPVTGVPRGRGGGGGGAFGTDLAELERDLRDRERDLVNGFTRSTWSAGGPAPGWGGPDRNGSPMRSVGVGVGGVGGSAAAGLLAFEPMVGPLFGSLGLLEGPMGPGGGGGAAAAASAMAMAAAGATPAQIQAAQLQQQQVHTLQRRTLMLRLPYAWTSLGLDMPAMVVQDGGAGGAGGGGGQGGSGGGAVTGGACLLVLPSDKPPTRAEAVAVEALLLEMLRDPDMAASRAAAWRADVLGLLCSEAIACLHETSKLRQGATSPGLGAAAAGGGASSAGGGGGGLSAVATAVGLGGGAAAAAGQAGLAASGDAAGNWQIRGLASVELYAPSILGPFTTLLQPSLQAHAAAIEAQRAGLASAHARTPSLGNRPSHAGGGGGGDGSGGGGSGADGGGGSSERRARRLRASASEATTLRSAHSLMSPYSSASLTVGVCVCLADLIRQVEVQCCERGRALASAWNTFMVAHQDSVDSLRRRTRGLQQEVEQLSSRLAERHDFTREIELLEFLKRENARFKSREAELLAKGLLTLQAAPGARDGSRLVVKAGGALGEALDAELTSRVARLRWQHAWQTLGTKTKRVAFQSGSALQPPPPASPRLTAGGPEAEAMVGRLALLQRLTLAVERAERRRQTAIARRKAAEEAAANGGVPVGGRYGRGVGGGGQHGVAAASPAELAAAVAAAGPGLAMKLLEGLDPEDTANLLSSLSVEAQVVLLTSLPELRRAEVLAAMSDADRAQVVVVMSSGMRAHTARVLGRGMWLATMRSIKDNPQLGARLLGGMEQQEAVDELVGWTPSEQQDAFAALELPTAARLVSALPSELRQKLLASMPPHLAANIVSAMRASPGAASLDELDFTRSVSILMAMDPSAAADLLQEMGSGRAAEALLGMDSLEARHSILESMMPRLAAETVLEMDGRGSAALRRPTGEGDVDVEGLSFIVPLAGADAPSPFPGTEALGEMPPSSADKIMGFMGVPDKAATLSRMDPERAAELLVLLHPSESVALLACLSEASQVLVVEAMKQEERDSMMKVLADASGIKARGRNKGRGKAAKGPAGKHPGNAKGGGGGGVAAGSPGPHGGGGGGAVGPSPRPSGGGGGRAHYNVELAASMSAAVDRRALDFIDEYSDGEGAYDDGLAVGGGGGGGAYDREARWSNDSGAVDSDAEGGGAEGAAAAAAAGLRAPRPPEAGGEVAGYGAGEASGPGARTSLQGRGGEEPYGYDEAASDGGRGGPSEGDAGGGRYAGGGGGGSAAAAAALRRYRASDADSMQHGLSRQQQLQQQPGGMRRSTRGGEGPAGSPLRASQPSSQLTPPASRAAGCRSATATGDGTPPGQGAAFGGRVGGGRDGSPGGPAGGLGTIKTAFRMTRQQQQQMYQLQQQGAAGGLAQAAMQEIAEILRAAAPAAPAVVPAKQLAMSQMLLGAFRESNGGGGPQLGIAPKNVRLAGALQQHRTARPRPKGWLMGLLESVYKDGEALLRRLGHMEALRRQSVPELVFAHFSNKYGQRSMVDEYVACLANTLAQHRGEDLRLETFARFLSEQWDFAAFFDFLAASSLALQPSKALCIEYPREAGRDEQYPWLCAHKAVAIADVVLGPREAALRERFNDSLLAVSVPADDIDVEKLKREPRYAAASLEAAAGGAPLPERYFRLPRPRFLAILASEVSRLNAAVSRLARGRFDALDTLGCDTVPASAVAAYLGGVVAPKTSPAANPAVQEAAQAFVANALIFQQEPGALATATPDINSPSAADTQLSLEAWVAASVHCPLLRDHVKMNVLRPRRVDADAADGCGGGDDGAGEGLLGGFLMGLTRRHTKIMTPRLRGWLKGGDAAGGGGGTAADAALAAELSSSVDKALSGGDKFRAYAQMLMAIIKHRVAAAVSLMVGDKGAANDVAAGEVEDALCRLEDCAVIMLKQARYMVECSSPDVQLDLVRRLPPESRIFAVGRQLLVWRQHRATVKHMAALVVQSVWRGHRRRRRAAEAEARAQALAQAQAEAAELVPVVPVPAAEAEGGGGMVAAVAAAP